MSLKSESEHAQVDRDISSPDLNRRRFLQAGAAGALAVSTGALLAACGSDDNSAGTGGGGSDRQVTFGFSHPFAEVPFVKAVDDGVKQNAEAEGWTIHLDDTQGGKLEDQLATLDTWITQKVTAICAFTPEPSAYEATAKRAVDAGIIWTTYAIPMKTGAGGALFSPEDSGKVTGKATVEWINANDPDAEVLVLEFPSPGEVRKRTDIPRKMIAEQTKAKVVAVQPAVDQATGFQVTQNVLQAHPNVTVVVGINDDGALGAVEAFRKAGTQEPSKVWIIGQDGPKDGLEALKDPKSYYRASVALDIAQLCKNTVAVTKSAIDRNWKPGDKQESLTLVPTLIKNGDTQLIDRFLKAF